MIKLLFNHKDYIEFCATVGQGFILAALIFFISNKVLGYNYFNCPNIEWVLVGCCIGYLIGKLVESISNKIID